MDYKDENRWLMLGDCLERMKEIPDGSVDMILTDPPFGTTKCKWDSIIPLEPMWEQLNRVIKPNGAIVLFCAEPFTSKLIMSGVDKFKYKLIWRKNRIQHFAQAPYRFLTETEDIAVFSSGGTAKNAKTLMKYYPQGLVPINKVVKGKGHSDHRPSNKVQDDYVQEWTNYPKNILEFGSVQGKTLHPTQKPTDLLEYLIKTYTLEGDTVLDFAAGSGSTGVACVNTNRKFIGIELDKGYFEIAKQRIEDAQTQDNPH